MNQRLAVRGRSSGTDGSDFSYRMDTRKLQSKVSFGKIDHRSGCHSVMIATNVFVSLSKNESPDGVSIVSLAIGFVSVVARELGRKKCRSNFVKFYVFGSLMAILLSMAYLAMSNLQLEAFQNFTSLETLKIAAVLLGFVVQLFVIGTTISLIKNMAPPKRAS